MAACREPAASSDNNESGCGEQVTLLGRGEEEGRLPIGCGGGSGGCGSGGSARRLVVGVVVLLTLGALALIGVAAGFFSTGAVATAGAGTGAIMDLYSDARSDCEAGCETVFKPCYAGKTFMNGRQMCKYNRWKCKTKCSLQHTTTEAPSAKGFFERVKAAFAFVCGG